MRIQLVTVLLIIFVKSSSSQMDYPNGLKPNTVGSECWMFHPGTNKNNADCCKYPTLFSNEILQKCKGSAMRGTVNGTTVLFEDSVSGIRNWEVTFLR